MELYPSEIQLSDQWQAAYLKLNGIEPLRIEVMAHKNLCAFFYEDCEDVHGFLREYDSDEGLRKYIKSIVTLKGAMRRVKRNHRIKSAQKVL